MHAHLKNYTLPKRSWFYAAIVVLACGAVLFHINVHSSSVERIAVIPRTSGISLWEPEHGGAETAAVDIGADIYWNAPTREDDVEEQIALVEHITNGTCPGSGTGSYHSHPPGTRSRSSYGNHQFATAHPSWRAVVLHFE
jgi:hypothetical protein